MNKLTEYIIRTIVIAAVTVVVQRTAHAVMDNCLKNRQ